MKLRILLFLLLETCLSASALQPVYADVYTAASCSSADVSAAMALASTGDTVAIPAGTCNWTSQVAWTAPANTSLVGAGNHTIGGGDVTNIVDNSSTNAPILKITTNSSGVFRMGHLTIKGGNGGIKDAGMFQINGPGTIRLHHLHLNSQSYSPVRNNRVLTLSGRLWGVLDHSILDLYSTSAVYIINGSNSGNTEWAEATNFGGSNYFFIEDNQINGTPASHDTRLYDCYTGGKVVVRFNTLVASTAGEDHATGHSSDDRGCRSKEIYGNDTAQGAGQTEPNSNLIDIGSGTALVWGNQANEVFKNGIHFNVTRKDNATYTQSATPNGWGYCGTSFNGTGSDWDENSDTVNGYACIDQPGRGQGDLLTGSFPSKVNSRTSNIAWPSQALEPVYTWNNNMAVVQGWGGSVYDNFNGGRIAADRDFYKQASGVQVSSSSPFNGTIENGWGTLANRPATCTTGVGYFATDQGNWNISGSNPEGAQQSGADGVLYTCTATNTWTLYYVPYQYPHPLNTTEIRSVGGTVSGGRVE